MPSYSSKATSIDTMNSQMSKRQSVKRRSTKLTQNQKQMLRLFSSDENRDEAVDSEIVEGQGKCASMVGND